MPTFALAQGDDWPNRNVRIVCPFTPGGSQDNIARRLAAKLSEEFGQTFVVENRTGAGGSIAADNVAKSPPDGYSVLLGNIGSHALVPHLYRKPAYNAVTDLETVALDRHAAQPAVLPSQLPARHAAQADRGGEGGARQVFLRLVGPRHLADADHGAVQAEDRLPTSPSSAIAARPRRAADVLAGHVPMVISNIDSLMSQVSAGKLKPMASSGAKRSPVTPNTPTFAETVSPDLVVTSWSIWAVPTGTPAKIKDKLRNATEKALKSPDVLESMKAGGFEPGIMTVPEIDAYIQTEIKRWGEVIRAAGIKPE